MVKKILGIVSLVALTAASAFAANELTGSKHNLSLTGTANNSNTKQMCIFCHTPHNAQGTKPLWNRVAPDNTAFILYSSLTMKNAHTKSGMAADSQSLLCISCHDGTAIGANMVVKPSDVGAAPVIVQKVGAAGSVTNDKITSTATQFGTDLSNHHPIGFNVTVQGDMNGLGIVTPDHKMMNSNGTGGGQLPLYQTSVGDNVLECGSCHQAHGSTALPKMLRYTMDGSKLCFSCHAK